MFHTVSRDLILILLFVNHALLSVSRAVTSKYLKIGTQAKPPLLKAQNFATLKSGAIDVLPSKKFTICGSISIGFFPGLSIILHCAKE